MRRPVLTVSLISVSTCIALGQAPAAPASFEVASIRVAVKAPNRAGVRDGVQFSPDSLTMRNTSFRAAIRWAYNVTDHQIVGPDWMAEERYDIVAKSAGQATEDQLRTMLQSLLAERFKLVVHRQTKELSAFVLMVGKNGPKFKESDTDGEMNVQPNESRLEVTVRRAPVSQLIDGLSQVMRAPVIDQTGLKGKYDVTVNIAKYIPDLEAARQAGAASGAPLDPVPIIVNGIQEELGLKLESKKVPLAMVIVDRAEKVPTEN